MLVYINNSLSIYLIVITFRQKKIAGVYELRVQNINKLVIEVMVAAASKFGIFN